MTRSPLNHLEIAFPGQSNAIAERRSTDAVFDEICRDYDEIAATLAEQLSANAEGSIDHIKDLGVSLEGLHEEIAGYPKPPV